MKNIQHGSTQTQFSLRLFRSLFLFLSVCLPLSVSIAFLFVPRSRCLSMNTPCFASVYILTFSHAFLFVSTYKDRQRLLTGCNDKKLRLFDLANYDSGTWGCIASKANFYRDCARIVVALALRCLCTVACCIALNRRFSITHLPFRPPA